MSERVPRVALDRMAAALEPPDPSRLFERGRTAGAYTRPFLIST